MTHRILNARNVLGTIAFLAMITAPGAVEAENYILATVLVAVLGICGHLGAKEDGKKR